MDDAQKVKRAKELLQSWVDQQSHDRCWYYPDIFNELVALLGVKQSKPSSLPPLSEFKKGCERYQKEEFRL